MENTTRTGPSNAERLFEKLEKIYLDQLPEDSRKTIHFDQDDEVYRFGEVPKGIFYIKEGSVKISRIGAKGKEVIIRVASSHDFIGYLSLLKSWSYLTSATCVEESEIYFVPKSIFLEAISSDHDFAYRVIDLVCESSIGSADGIVDLASKNVKQRLCASLLTLDKIQTKAYGQTGLISFRKKDISSMIGAAPETVSRYLAELETGSLIKVNPKNIEIINKHGLATISSLGD